MDKLEESHYFVTPLYAVKKTEFLESVNAVSNRYLELSKGCKGKNKVVTMTANYSNESEISNFTQYVSQTAWNILKAQGFNMTPLVTYFLEMWTQEHNHMSSMDQHVHGLGAQISAFFFLDTPKNGCKIVIHDPRPGKVILNLPMENDEKVTQASTHIVFTPEPGTLIFMPAWVPHSFTRNVGKEPTRFVHMNLSVAMASSKDEPEVEVI